MNTTSIEEQRDVFGLSTGVELETLEEGDGEKIAEPFDPDDIDVVTKPMTVDLLLSRIKSSMIDLQPDFQRRWGVWDAKRQSRLIESLLLRIPLPVLYAAEDGDERWEIVDGIQRLSTIARFIEPSSVSAAPLILHGLEYLHDYENKSFADLSERLKLRLRETELIIHLIRKGTPPEVKFNIFARINTGGVSLSAQELRHAITPGKARDILLQWSALKEFKQATDGSIKAIRMDDREVVLRFLAFYMAGLEAYRQPDMDGFLIRAMKIINETSDVELNNVRQQFISAMSAAQAIFGLYAFRKRFTRGAPRLPINKALFEAVSVSLARLDQKQIALLLANKDAVQDRIIGLCNDRSFEAAISQGTGDIRKVNRRFAGVSQALKEVLEGA